MTELGKALLAFQKEGVKLQKNAINPHFKNKYISLDSLMEQILPILNKYGLVLLQMPCYPSDVPSLTTRIVHADTGEHVESTMSLVLAKFDPQAQGSALTYARRYALMAFLGLVADEDTDGQSRSAKPQADTSAPVSQEGFATEAQRKRLFALAKENGVDTPALKEIIERITGQGSTAQIPKGKYDAVCAAVQASGVPFE